MSGLAALLGKLRWGRVDRIDMADPDYSGVVASDGPGELASANVVTSRRIDNPDRHALLLDLDVPAYLVPSSTEGHSHLYIDVSIEHDKWECLMECLSDAGVIERGYAGASEQRGFATLRLPWVKKQEPELAGKALPDPFGADLWAAL